VLCPLLVLVACDPAQSPGPSVGSNSNWLRACKADTECDGAPSCVCGACSFECSRDSDCDMLPAARCALDTDPASVATCDTAPSSAPAGICLPRCTPGSCRDGQTCVAQACVLTPMPNNAFCMPAAHPVVRDRSNADELLALLQDKRTSGGLTCGGTAAPPAPALRLDARLVCAARIFAADLEVTHAPNLIDSQGRQSDQRMQLAGYAPRQWGEAFALQPMSAQDALQIMLADVGTCMRFADPQFTDVGVGSSGSARVISLGAQ
jgi:uncharacterized protein YkwD